MTEDLGPELPEQHREMDQLLRGVRFKPRASLEAEVLGRVRRGEQSTGSLRLSALWRSWPVPLLAGTAAIFASILLAPEPRVTIDSCCWDLDGGGKTDDGALIIARRDGQVYRLSVYEDRDGSGSLTAADTLRFDRVGSPGPEQLVPAGLTRIVRCCRDLDGGGAPDDGILIGATPPDRVHTAAIYELR